MTPPPPRPRQPSRPELPSIVTPDQPEREAVRHPGLDGANQPPPQRRGTLPGGMAAIPDRASGEYAPTLLQRLTVRRPTPPSTVVKARRSDPPTTTAESESADAPQSLPEAQTALLRDELAKSRARVAELERDKRAAAEVKVASFPPPVQQREPGSAPSSVAQRGETGARGAPASKVMQWTAFVAAITALVATLGQIFKPDTSKDQAAYEAIRAELVKQNEALAKNGKDDETRWNFVTGLFAATGVKLTSAQGTPPVEAVALAPAPLITKLSPKSAPMIQVAEPLPAPAASVAPVALPKSLEALPARAP